jgi:hypothetical protein
MLQQILDKYINPEVSNSTIIHTNSQMRFAIIETFKLIVEDIKQLIEDNEDIIDNEMRSHPSWKVEQIIQEYYNEQL